MSYLCHTATISIVAKPYIKVPKEYLNYGGLKVTEIYAKVLDKQLKDAVEV